jgi:hypothetical protein
MSNLEGVGAAKEVGVGAAKGVGDRLMNYVKKQSQDHVTPH